jgi:phosphoribosylamine---glycine ligase
MLPAQDHKRIGEGDTGPNTGGMGAYAPSRSPTRADRAGPREILLPTLARMRADGHPFRGLLYAGLMLTPRTGRRSSSSTHGSAIPRRRWCCRC